MLFLVLFYSCEDSLDLTPVSSISSNSFWNSEEDVVSATYGMYNQFRATFDIKTVIWGDYRTGFYGQGRSTATDWDELWNNDMNSTSVGANWSSLYILINDANLILAKAPEIPFANESERDHLLGQAHFVRAYTYFQIAKIWGDAPIVTEGFESTTQVLDPARSPKTEVFGLIKEDLENAINLMEEKESVNTLGRTAANMLKTDVYLWTAKVEGGGEADLRVSQQAVDAVLASGHALLEDYEQVFRDENNPEIIFSIFYSELESGTGGRNGSGGRSQTGTHPSHITLPELGAVPPNLQDEIPWSSSPQWLALSEHFLNTYLQPEAIDSRTKVNWEVVPSGNTEITWINKYLGEEFSGTRLPTSDLIIYRYAEAILFKAEIENALGNTSEALNYLNRIAERAYGVPNYYSGLNQEETNEAILNERIVEFVLEGKSWFDIQRFGKAFEIIPTLEGREGDNNGNILYFPVDQDVMNRNTNIEQTSGY